MPPPKIWEKVLDKLPEEILDDIIALSKTSERNEYGALIPDIRTLSSLALVSKDFNRLSTPHLYKTPMLRNKSNGSENMLRFLMNARWTTPRHSPKSNPFKSLPSSPSVAMRLCTGPMYIHWILRL
jgi:hypothetical protein